MRLWALTVVATLAAGPLALAGPAPSPGDEIAPPQGVRLEQRLNQPVPLDLPFHDDQGKVVRLRDCLGGKPTILVLSYYKCPMLCTRVLNDLTTSLRKIDDLSIGEQFNVVTVSFDPKEDANPALTAAKKVSYVESYGRPHAAEGWHFLTGNQEAIDALTQAVGFHYRWDEDQRQYDHPSGIMILSPDGRLFRYFYGLDYPPRDVRFSLKEASQGGIPTTLADEVLLRCFLTYDHSTGRYTPDVMKLLRLGGALTVLAVGAFVLVSLRRERRKAAAGPKPAG
jgi:protein SCO1/2